MQSQGVFSECAATRAKLARPGGDEKGYVRPSVYCGV
jgi:hypothetical protein